MRMARTTIATLTATALAVGSLGGAVLAQDAAMAEPGQDLKVMLLPKFTDNQVFQQANEGAQEAAAELGVSPADFVGPASTDTGSAQVAFVVNAPTQEYDVLLISNNVGEEMADAAVAAQDVGIKIVTWDSPIASGKGEDVFVAQVDFDETGTVMADMALSILPDGGQMAVLSAKPESPNQNAWIAAMEVALEDPAYEGIELVEIAERDQVNMTQRLAYPVGSRSSLALEPGLETRQLRLQLAGRVTLSFPMMILDTGKAPEILLSFCKRLLGDVQQGIVCLA